MEIALLILNIIDSISLKLKMLESEKFIEESLNIKPLKCLIRPGMYFSVNYLIWFLRISLRTLQNIEANLSVNSENIEVKHKHRSSLKLKHSFIEKL